MTDDAGDAIDDIPSPCVRNCCLDENDVCLGCYRTIAEIMRWSEAADDEKREILIQCRLRSRQRRGKINEIPSSGT